jgi:ketosteroid isomerase-like protein
MVLMTRSEALAWTREWIDQWNRRDVDGVLARFADDVVFTSPRVPPIMGKTGVSGKRELAAYWNRGMAAIQSIHFDLDYAIVDGNRLGIIYTSNINGKRMRSVEFLRFDDAGLVCEGEAMHGVVLS